MDDKDLNDPQIPVGGSQDFSDSEGVPPTKVSNPETPHQSVRSEERSQTHWSAMKRLTHMLSV